MSGSRLQSSREGSASRSVVPNMLSTKSINASDAAIGPVYVDGGMLAVL